ncbi:MAG: hypothetical protein HKN15_05190 [Xanthomonadales bacterium]|nr:hypothetical protein [Xanthomonadales bacterium]
MDNIPELTSACYARQPVDGPHSLRELPLEGKLNLRGNIADTEFTSAVDEVLGTKLPAAAHTSTEGASGRMVWLGPDEWQFCCDIDSADSLFQALRDRLGPVHSAVTEVSDYYTVLRLTGPDAEAILRRGCPLDLHPDKFTAGTITQTRFGHASILLQKNTDGESWEIQVRWTYAEYLWDYLVSAMKAVESS